MTSWIATGPRIGLRRVEERDASGPYLQWMADPEVVRYIESREAPTAASLRDYIRAQRATPSTVFCAIVLFEDGRHIGNIKAWAVEPRHATHEMGILLGDRASWGKRLATEAISVLSRHLFDACGVGKLSAGCYAPNIASSRAFMNAGFTIEGVRKGYYVLDGARVDKIELGRLPTDPSPEPGVQR